MDMGHGDMDMDSHACKISMLWNWYTIDSCFLSATWHVRSKGGFAGSVIGVFLLCIAIEFVRRVGREYDRRLIMAAKAGLTPVTLPEVSKDASSPTTYHFRPSWVQQIIRGIAYGSQFTAAFLVMLFGMFFNGYILFVIFLGQTVGYIIFGRDTCTAAVDHVASGSCC
ncbi:uncharacterized protein I303_108708 [Kwoniella dejecticola CBS 10117]|uniref:Copper transport protein n=1 Tax=Kwoniella dejecticola CBS 10117 TaxID=1296121 RepID=A0A1A5ZWM6_9TREE|nr:uncharacterized protein I303_06967 [Kwoniella dejecticola CBS 10117]OBR82208.1 hypothetical protein I303_06967 [Kwoniella dejecticola CBS 10117]